jgi:preprotein translocase subunit SecE
LPDKHPEEKAVAKDDKKAIQKQPNRVQRYYRETMGELRKVTWPTRQEATNLTIVVLIVVAAMSAFLGFLDYIFGRLFFLLFGG